jgi:hypothetical protein
MLATYIAWLAGDREAGEEIGRRAAAHISAHHALDLVAGRYWEILEQTTRSA